MNKKEIKAAISIEFGLSFEQSGKVVDSIFSNITDCFRIDSIVEIQKFGKFKIITGKDTGKSKSVKFAPSKKLSLRVNSNFENLTKVKLKPGKEFKLPVDTIGIESEVRVLKTAEKDNKPEPGKIIPQEKPSEKVSISGQRKLISEDLINLHKEITREDAKEANKDNLWG